MGGVAASNNTWEEIRAGAVVIWAPTDTNPNNLCGVNITVTASRWIARTFLEFNLASVSVKARSGRLKVYGYLAGANARGFIGVASPFGTPPVVDPDWTEMNDKVVPMISYYSPNPITVPNWLTATITGNGLNYINSNLGSVIQFGLLEHENDFPNDYPTSVIDRRLYFYLPHEAGYEPYLDLDGAILEIAFNQSIFTVSPSWTDVSKYLRTIHVERGRMHELDRIEAGTALFVLDNTSSNFWRGNTAGDYYPNVKPLQLIRLQYYYNGTTYKLFYGVIESFVHKWQDEDAAYGPEVEVNCVDVFKSLARAKIIDANPELDADAASGQKDVYVDSVYGLVVGQSIKIYDDAASEVNTISAISNADSKVTMTNNLAATYTQANNAKLKKFPQVLSGTRIMDVLLEWGWPSSLTDLDAGQSNVIEHSPPAGGTNALEHIQAVAEAENGIFFQEPDGTLNFQDSIARQSSPYDTSQATFKDDGSNSKYSRPQISDDEEFIYNQADISGEGIGEQSVYDGTLQATQGPRALTRSDSLLADETEALFQCFVFVERYKDSILRPRQFVVKPDVVPSDLIPKALGYDISTRITVQLDSTRNPAELNRDYHIEGISHDWNAQEDFWITTWQLWEVNQYRVIGINHDGYLLNTDGASYQAVHDAASSSVPASNDAGVIEVGQWDVYAGAIWLSSRIERGYMEFDTSVLSGFTVAEAFIFIKVYAPSYESTDWELTLVDPDAIGNPLTDTDYGDMEPQQTSLGSVTIDSNIVPFTWLSIELNSSGVSHIDTGGTTKFGLRSDKDIDEDDPGTNAQDWAKIFGKGSAYEPILIVKLDL